MGLKKRRRLKPDAVPTIFVRHVTPQQTTESSSSCEAPALTTARKGRQLVHLLLVQVIHQRREWLLKSERDLGQVDGWFTSGNIHNLITQCHCTSIDCEWAARNWSWSLSRVSITQCIRCNFCTYLYSTWCWYTGPDCSREKKCTYTDTSQDKNDWY